VSIDFKKKILARLEGGIRVRRTASKSWRVPTDNAVQNPFLEVYTMKNQQQPKRVSSNPELMVVKPMLRETHLTMQYILNLPAHGTTVEEILDEYVTDSSKYLLFFCKVQPCIFCMDGVYCFRHFKSLERKGGGI
jgi:uncharacterized protein (DUF433 family)